MCKYCRYFSLRLEQEFDKQSSTVTTQTAEYLFNLVSMAENAVMVTEATEKYLQKWALHVNKVDEILLYN